MTLHLNEDGVTFRIVLHSLVLSLKGLDEVLESTVYVFDLFFVEFLGREKIDECLSNEGEFLSVWSSEFLHIAPQSIDMMSE